MCAYACACMFIFNSTFPVTSRRFAPLPLHFELFEVSTILDFSSKRDTHIPIYSKPHFIFTILFNGIFSLIFFHQFLKSTSCVLVVGGGGEEKTLESMPCMTLWVWLSNKTLHANRGNNNASNMSIHLWRYFLLRSPQYAAQFRPCKCWHAIYGFYRKQNNKIKRVNWRLPQQIG